MQLLVRLESFSLPGHLEYQRNLQQLCRQLDDPNVLNGYDLGTDVLFGTMRVYAVVLRQNRTRVTAALRILNPVLDEGEELYMCVRVLTKVNLPCHIQLAIDELRPTHCFARIKAE